MEKLEICLFRVPKFALKFLGFWPETKFSTLGFVHGIFNLTILVSAVTFKFSFGIQHIDTPIEALDAVCPSLSELVTILKLCMLFIYRRQLRVVIKKIRDLLKAEENESKLKILKRMKILTRIFGAIVFFLGNATNGAYFLRPIVHNIINFFTGRQFSKELPFVAALPFDLTPWKNFVFGYSIIAYSGFITAFGLGGIDGFYVEFCFYISALFQLSQEDIKSALSTVEKDVMSPAENELARKKLGLFIAKHSTIMELCSEIVELFTIIVMGHFVTAAIVICISCVDFIMATGFNIVLYIVHSVAVMTELFVYCIGGSSVVDSSTNISRVCYFCDWYKYDVKTQKMIMLIMLRAQIGTGVTVPFFAPSVPLFGTMLRTAGSYITLLKTFL